MVSAADGALLIPHLPEGQLRLGMLMACYAMFGISLFATLFIVPQVWRRLVVYKTGIAASVPTVWIVLGPLGQSITAVNLLASDAAGALPPPYGQAASAFGLFYGVPTWGFAAMWMALATALTLRTARQGLPFALTWWSFTFPVGTVVTGTSAPVGADPRRPVHRRLGRALCPARGRVDHRRDPYRTGQSPRVPLPAHGQRELTPPFSARSGSSTRRQVPAPRGCRERFGRRPRRAGRRRRRRLRR